MHPRNRRVRTLSRRAWLIVALAAILLAFARRPVAAQPPLRSPLGYPDSQFVVMAISQTHSDPDPDHGKLWQLLDVLGIDAVEQYSNPTELNDLATSTLRKSSQKLISKFAPGEAGHGIEVQLYPFTSIDTAQSPLYVSKFIYRNGGVLVHNAVLGDSASGPYTEQRYD